MVRFCDKENLFFEINIIILFGRSKNANFRTSFDTSKKKNVKSWNLKTVYDKHPIYFSDF